MRDWNHWRRQADEFLARHVARGAQRNIEQLAPNLMSFIKQVARGLLVADTLPGQVWVHAIRGNPSVLAIGEFLEVWELLAGVFLSEEPDTFSWLLGAAGKYSSREMY